MADGGGGHEEFVLLVIQSQARLYAYILSLVIDRERARDILQQTNLVMLEKENDFEPGTNFAAWAYRVAFYEVLADRRNRTRDKHLFSDELISLIAARSADIDTTFDARTAALEGCLQKLPAKQRETLLDRYNPGGSVAKIAEQLGKTPSAVSAMLYRIRSSLLDCIERKLGGQSV